MHKNNTLEAKSSLPTVLTFLICVAIMVGSFVVASLVQRDFGRVHVTNVMYQNFNGIRIRAKLLRPVGATKADPMPGVVYIHGYQNNRETGDAYCIELARRGFVVLNIDAIGRGNSGMPNDPKDPTFDKTYGGLTSLKVLRSLPFVNPKSVGMLGHSLGAEMAYQVALGDPGVNALVISGFAYTQAASSTSPKNMLMIIGKWDEFKQRMTGTRDIETEWMSSAQTKKVIPVANPQIGVTYGEFEQGTARRVVVPRTIHFMESHNRGGISEMLEWMRKALRPPERLWIDSTNQTWPIKEWATFIAMLACFASLLPLSRIFLGMRFFNAIEGAPTGNYACSVKSYLKFSAINGVLMWLYLPLIFVLFGVHVYLVHIDGAFPMMMVNGVVWWFFWINVIGFFIFRRRFRKESWKTGYTWADAGVSYRNDRFGLDGAKVGKTLLLASILFGFAYFSEYLLEQIFIVDFRFLFPFASDLTAARAWMCLRYFPFILVGFVLMEVFLHGQLRRPGKGSRLATWISWSFWNLVAMIAPVILFLMMQYVPLFTTGFIPLVGPGGMFVSFILNLFHIMGVLIVVVPLSTWFFQLTGKIYLGALVNGLIVTWMFVSSQVVAPIPV
jgi:pimeloyl-ACP methyl ester carboxylesterase